MRGLNISTYDLAKEGAVGRLATQTTQRVAGGISVALTGASDETEYRPRVVQHLHLRTNHVVIASHCGRIRVISHSNEVSKCAIWNSGFQDKICIMCNVSHIAIVCALGGLSTLISTLLTDYDSHLIEYS